MGHLTDGQAAIIRAIHAASLRAVGYSPEEWRHALPGDRSSIGFELRKHRFRNMAALAAEYNTTPATVSRIINNKFHRTGGTYYPRKPRVYKNDQAIREAAVREAALASSRGDYKRIAESYGISPSTLAAWRKNVRHPWGQP